MTVEPAGAPLTREQLLEAFSSEESPPKEVLYSSQRAVGDPEMSEVQDYLGGRPWTDVTLVGLMAYPHVDARASWFWLSADSRRYYLPAWISMALEGHYWSDDLGESLHFWLCGGTGAEEWVTNVRDLAERLSEPQRGLVCVFLEEGLGPYGSPFPEDTDRGLKLFAKQVP